MPAALAERLLKESSCLAADVTEAYALDLFHRGKLRHRKLSDVLRLDRAQTDACLERHGVYEGSPTMADLDADRSTLENLFGGNH